MAPAHSEIYDLLIVTDATLSMGAFLKSLNSSLQDIIRISTMTGCFSRIGVIAYRDYAEHGRCTDWSGWHSRDAQSEISQDALLSFVQSLRMFSGGDWAEATRTGLALAYQVMRPEAKTIILLYSDALPHTEADGGLWEKEQDELTKIDTYGGSGKLFADWVSVANTLSSSDKKAQVFGIIEICGYWQDLDLESMITYLSTRTGGVCLEITRKPSPETISKLTVNLLLHWMGAEKQGAVLEKQLIATRVDFIDHSAIDQLASEKDPSSFRYLPTSSKKHDRQTLKANMRRDPISIETLSEIVPRREHPMDFSKRYREDPTYREIVIEQLTQIIETDVSAIALNPVFGSLWRTVCNDRLNPARDQLITNFGLEVNRIESFTKKEDMKKWLEASYDFVGEITDMIAAVPDESRYPCVFLDPTVRFSQTSGQAEEDTESSTTFTRDELLEIGRSCDPRILRRLGHILTRMTYVNSKEELPAHVKDTPEIEVPRIPMALVKQAHERKFWKVLLHAVLPGTMLTARPAALLAALSLRMGIKPLEEAAYTELMASRDIWNTLDIPETWNTQCLSLLLEADKKHQLSAADARTGADNERILKEEDRNLFESLVNYKLLEMNLDMELMAEVGWTPSKSKAPLGPVVNCKACHFPRSVTVMASDHVCGLCAVEHVWESTDAREAFIRGGVSKDDTSSTLATWTECNMKDCRAQYVVYHPEDLRVRPKCHYCRQRGTTSGFDPDIQAMTTAPCVECTKCKSRIIWPAAYRPKSFEPSTYQCPACTAGTPSTIVKADTTPRALAKENGTAWLLRNDDETIPSPFTNRSLFHIISTATCTQEGNRHLFPSKVAVLPAAQETADPVSLTIRGKPIHNTASLIHTLGEHITSHRVQAGTCSLCFSNFMHGRLHLACGGRKGCRERICAGCARDWYGLNAPGRIVNVAALACPFCRRQPTHKVKLLNGLRFLGGLRDAVNDKGMWVYAWCSGGCGSAKKFAERVCAQGAPEELENWRCEECNVGRQTVKTCPAPNCGVAVEKSSGCDHIECVCGKHWCFNCGEKVADTAGEIYKHMTQVHQTWYALGPNGEEGEYDYSDYEEDEEDEGDW
ncbi:hypothetical protein VTI28DRAFT_2128 [Corynascus sepedonium]